MALCTKSCITLISQNAYQFKFQMFHFCSASPLMHLGKRHKRSKSFGSPNPGGRTRSSPWIWTGPTPDAVTALAVHQQMQHKPLTAFQITKHSKYRNIMDMKKFFRSYNFYEQLCATRFASQEDMDKLLKLTRTEETECLSRY